MSTAAREQPGWLRALVGYLGPHRGLVGLVGLTSVGTSVIAAGTPLVLRHIVDTQIGRAGGAVWSWVGVLLGLAVFGFAVNYGLRVSSRRLGLEVGADLRRDVFQVLTRLSGRQQDELDTGQVVSRTISDLALIGGVLAFLAPLFSEALLFVLSLVIMLVISPLLTLVAAAIVPALWFVSRHSRSDLFPANWEAQQQAAELVGQIDAAVAGVRVVKGFGQEDRELAQVQRSAVRLFASRLRAVRMEARYGPALEAIPAVGQIGVLCLGGWLALRGQITLGTFLAFSAYIGGLVAPVNVFAEFLVVGPQGRAGFERVYELARVEPGIVDAPDARPIPPGPVHLVFDDVRFGYRDTSLLDTSVLDTSVLDGLSLTVEAGETLAVVGRSGCGKSTVVELIDRFYDVDSGSVQLNGIDVRAATLSGLRAASAVVFEESLLFTTTIFDNIAYGRPDASMEQVRAAARVAQADDFITALPEGYSTVIGERGHTLSGGQRQRIALARALLPDAGLLVLDDATSAVDPRVEADIVAALRTSASARTTILITHRRSTLELADRVVLLAGGRVAASGTAAEVRNASAEFRGLFYPEDEAASAQVGIEPVVSAVARTATLAPTAAARHAASLVQSGAGNQTAARDGGLAAGAPRTDELLARVAALPAAAGTPGIPDEQAVKADRHLSVRRLVRPVRGALLLGLVLVAAQTGAQLLFPVIVRSGIDQGVTAGSQVRLFWLGVIAVVIACFQFLVSRAARLVTGRTGERLLYLLRVKTFAHLQRLGLDYYERERSGQIMTRVTTDVDSLSGFLQSDLFVMFVSAVTMVGVLVALLLLQVQLALTLVALLPVVAVVTLWYRHRSVPTYVLTRERQGALNATLHETIGGLRVLQAYGRVARVNETFLAQARDYIDARMSSTRAAALYFPFITMLNGAAVALIVGFGAGRIADGTLTIGTLIAFVLYLEAFFGPVQQLSEVFDSYQQAAVGLARLRELLATPTSTPPAADPLPVARLDGGLDLVDVGFRYRPGDPLVLEHLTASIRPGETVALVGETGAGKSTVVKLLSRLYDPTSGSVRAGGHDLRRLDLGQYRRRVGLVPQEPYLSAGTVSTAIAYGRPDATRAEVVRAATAVGAHPAIAALAGGYDHPVGERGRNLSAGQRQLIALARAEMVDPDVLLLDEATASLDLASEAAVARATRELTRQRTTIVVAHRLTTAARADRILVIAAGRVVESGPHQELLANNGPYAQLWAAYADRPIENRPE